MDDLDLDDFDFLARFTVDGASATLLLDEPDSSWLSPVDPGPSTGTRTPPIPIENPSALAKGKPRAKDTNGKLASCAACRLRRVKCHREPGEKDCTGCKARYLTCVPMPRVQRRTPARTGKRLEQAKALFGEKDMMLYGMPTMDPANAVAAKLITSELEGALAASLLDLYFQLPQSRLPLLEGTNFRRTVEAANRRISELDTQSQVLFSVILALGARVSSHPLLIGGNGPSPAELIQATREGKDLSRWGKQRESACEALLTKATEKADAAGVWRTPSLVNVATLMLLEGMNDHYPGEQFMIKRSFASAYMSHLRDLLSEKASPAVRERVLNTGVGWSAYMRDVAVGAHTGLSPFFSEDDRCLLGGHEYISPLKDILALPFGLGDTEEMKQASFWSAFSSVMVHLSEISRDCPPRLTGRRAMRRPYLDEAFVKDMLDRLETAGQGLARLQQYTTQLHGSIVDASDEGKICWTIVRGLSITRCILVLLLQRVIIERRHARNTPVKFLEPMETGQVSGTSVPDDDNDDNDDHGYRQRLATLELRTTEESFYAAREIIDTLDSSLKAGMSMGVATGSQLLISRLPFWLRRLLDTPTAEEDGPFVQYTFDEKLKDIRAVLRTLKTVAWSFEKLARCTPWLEQEIVQLEQRQAAYWARLASDLPTSASSFLPDSSLESDLHMTDSEYQQLLSDMTTELFPPQGGASDLSESPQRPKTEEDIVVAMFSSLLG